MEKDERKPLDAESVRRLHAKRSKMTLAISLGGGLLAGLICRFTVASAIREHNYLVATGHEGMEVGDVLPRLLPWVLILVFCIVHLARAMRVLWLIRRNRLEIHEDVLADAIELFGRRQRVYRLKLAIYGKKNVNRHTYEMCAIGDTLYAVVLHGRWDTLLDIYSPLTYRLTDNDREEDFGT